MIIVIKNKIPEQIHYKWIATNISSKNNYKIKIQKIN